MSSTALKIEGYSQITTKTPPTDISLQEAKDARCTLRAEIFHAHTTGNEPKELELSSEFNALTDVIEKLTQESSGESSPTPPESIEGTISSNGSKPYSGTNIDVTKPHATALGSAQPSENKGISKLLGKINKILNISTHN